MILIAKTFLRVVLGLIAIGVGYGMYSFWQMTRPDDPANTPIIAGVVVGVAAFVCLFFLTKGGD